jgi:hypothetical protein
MGQFVATGRSSRSSKQCFVEEATTRSILLVSGVLFLGLTALVAAWARRIKDQFAPQDDLVEIDGEMVTPAAVE